MDGGSQSTLPGSLDRLPHSIVDVSRQYGGVGNMTCNPSELKWQGQKRALASAPHASSAFVSLIWDVATRGMGRYFKGPREFRQPDEWGSSPGQPLPLGLQALSDDLRLPTFPLTSACTPALESSKPLIDAVPDGEIWVS